MRNPWLTVLDTASADWCRQSEPPTRTYAQRPLRLEWLAVAAALCLSGCIAPCSSGVCNSPTSLFQLPTPRYNATECVTDNGCGEAECEKGSCKPQPYYTFNKYCPWFDEWHTTSAAKRCANRILLKQQWQLLKLMPADYKKGFRQAFVDVAHGSDGELPAVPPPVYWNAHFRSDAGQRKAECWFSGYRAGAAMAAVQLAPMKRIAASYDWTVQKPKSPFAGGECLPCGLVGQSGNGQAGNNVRPAGFQPGPGQPQQLLQRPQFGPQYGPQIPNGPPVHPRYGPQPMMSPPPMAQPVQPYGAATFAPGGPVGPVENLPAPPQGGGGLAPGHSMPGQPPVTNPAAMANPQTGSSGSLMPGFSSSPGRAPAAAVGPWGDSPKGELVY